MQEELGEPRVFNILRGEAERVKQTPYGAVGTVYSGSGIEAVWVSKRKEEINAGWFSQPMVDLILVVQGQLLVEFENPRTKNLVMSPGDLLILPAKTQCRACRWPREAEQATVFFAACPKSN
jgi:hypothetical protein